MGGFTIRYVMTEHGEQLRIEMHVRSEEHTSELQSLTNLVCRLLLEKKKKTKKIFTLNGSLFSSANQTTCSPCHS